MGRTTVRRHLRRISAPRTWPIPRKGSYWVIKPTPGPHSIEYSMPIALWIRDYLKYARTLREVKYILNSGKVLVDGKVVKDYAYPVGLFDVLSFPDLNEHYRVLMNRREKLILHPIDEKEARIKILRIKKKNMVNGGRVQLTLFDGRNVLVEDPKEYTVGDSLLIEIPSQSIVDHIKLEKGALLYFISGERVGLTGRLEEIKVLNSMSPNILFYRDEEGNLYQSKPEYTIVIGRERPLISLPEF